MNNNFIEVEEFLGQSKKVQKSFIDWWQPKVGDIIGIEYEVIGKNLCTQKFWKYECINENDLFNYETKEELINSFIKVNCTGRYYLCLNMSQLVNYIEDKTHRQVKIYPDFYKEKYYTIMLRNTGCSGGDPSFEVTTDSMLKALFVVACRISV